MTTAGKVTVASFTDSRGRVFYYLRALRSPRRVARAVLRRFGQLRRVGLDLVQAPPRPPPPLPPVAPSTGVVAGRLPAAERPLSELRVACILDEFSFRCFAPECRLFQLTPANWEVELSVGRPELLLVESAWKGEGWSGQIGHASAQLRGVLDWCRSRGIPSAFWNKEDPVHFETFLSTAGLFDLVFTTDIDCVAQYKAALGHDRVFLLPFACQPALHNPIETQPRRDAFCFAGAYYARYPERIRDLEDFLKTLPEYRPVEIYDRNLGSGDANYSFPPALQKYVVGNLPFDRIDVAYKGYRYAINLNSVKNSQTMFARRVFELLASNTLTVSNYSRGLKLAFGDLVPASDSGAEIVARLRALAARPGAEERLRLAGLRKVMAEHTYADRLACVAARAGRARVSLSLPAVTVIATAAGPVEAEAIITSVRRQQGVEARLLLFTDSVDARALAEASGAVVRPAAPPVPGSLAALALAGTTWIAGMVAADHYGPSYLLDLLLATRFSPADVIGKAAHARLERGAVEMHDSDKAYRPASALAARRAVISRPGAAGIEAARWLRDLATWRYEMPRQIALDPWNYCESGAEPRHAGMVAEAVDDLPVDSGLAMDALQHAADAVTAAGHLPQGEQGLMDAASLASHFAGFGDDPRLAGTLLPDGWRIVSTLGDGNHLYRYGRGAVSRAVLTAGQPDGLFRCHLEATPGLAVSLVLLFLDGRGQRIGHEILPANRNHTVAFPPGMASARLGLRVYASGTTVLRGLLFGHRDLTPRLLLGARAPVLLVTNNYPAYGDLYRNAFVHRRVELYAGHGVPVDVFRLQPGAAMSYHEFRGVEVASGSTEALRLALASGHYGHVLVHFLDAPMWSVLRDFIDTIRVTVWVHGAEIQPWWRREYEHRTPEDLDRAKNASAEREAFWRELFAALPRNLHFVFVSRYFAEEVAEDYGLRLDPASVSIIHNPVDTSLFAYRPKDPRQRTKILSIRSFASRKYANDLSVGAIIELSKKPFFRELEFRIVGDGRLFEETVAPLEGLDNVLVERRFMTQPEIAVLQRDYGVFLTPSRWDSQGVSRDEAMSAGLVPVTTAIAAVPEFVDAETGILTAPESSAELAAGIERLYHSPDLFQAMSRAAADRVRRQSGVEHTVARELALFAPAVEASSR